MTPRQKLQEKLEALNPAAAELARSVAAATDRNKAWQRALRAGTAADANKVVAGVVSVAVVCSAAMI